jgi:hypothetical protein
MHRSCVREIAAGERVNARAVVTHANGERETLADCPYARLNARTFEPIAPASDVFATTSGWIEASDWTSPTGLGFLSATFTVPSLPTSTGGTVFFFPGAEPGDGSTILQPVLQYGASAAGGGDSWGIASWFCCPAGWSFYSSLTDVNPGDTIEGTMTAGCAGGSCDWSVVTEDTTLGASTTLPADDVTSSFTCIYGGVLEAYSVSECSQFPASRLLMFENIVLRDENGDQLEPSWTTFVNSVDPSCGYDVQTSTSSTTLAY